MRITYTRDIEASQERRTITGTVVPFGEIGQTSAGPVIFAADAINNLDPNNIRLLLEHDQTAPIGRAISLTHTADGITGSFRVAKTTRGNDALIEASDGLRDGLSVGVKATEWTNAEDGTMTVTAAQLVEVSLVSSPAFDQARVTDVAAAKKKEPNMATPEPTPDTEPEPTPEPAAEPAAEPTVPVDVDPRVFAPVAYSRPRVDMNISAGRFLEANVRAAVGDPDARNIVAALATNQTSGNAGVIPVPYMREILGIVDSQRPFIDSIGGAATLPASGMTFRIPTWGTQPTQAQTAELAQPSSTATSITNTTVTVVKFAGAENISVELLDRSDPAYFDELIRVLTAKYAQQTDAYALGIAKTGAVATTQTGLSGSVAILGKAMADAFGVLRTPPNRLLVASDKWQNLITEKDTSGRPIYSPYQPMNGAGVIPHMDMRGQVMGLDLYVDPNATAGDGVVYRSDAIGFYETASPVQVRVTQVSSLSVDVSVYGYCAAVVKYANSVRTVVL